MDPRVTACADRNDWRTTWMWLPELPFPAVMYTVDVEDEVTDDVLRLVPTEATSLLIRGPSNTPVRISCKFNNLPNLRDIQFMAVCEGLEADSAFEGCTHLENLWIGAHANPLFEQCTHLPLCPLKNFGMNGYGSAMNWSRPFATFMSAHPEIRHHTVL